MKKGVNFFMDNGDFKTLNDELVVRYDSYTVEEIWEKANSNLQQLEEKYKKTHKSLRPHLDIILPFISIYMVLLEACPENAMELVAEQSKMNAIRERKAIVDLCNKKPQQFFKECKSMAKKDFSDKALFNCTVTEESKNSFTFEITENAYLIICTGNGCPELAQIFNDRFTYLYSHLPGVAFKRSGALTSDLTGESNDEDENQDTPSVTQSEKCTFSFAIKETETN